MMTWRNNTSRKHSEGLNPEFLDDTIEALSHVCKSNYELRYCNSPRCQSQVLLSTIAINIDVTLRMNNYRV